MSGALRRGVDFLLAGFGLLLLWPVFLVVAIAIRRSVGVPVLFRQVRPGLHGKPFTLFKFRTMSMAADPDGALLPDAARITATGRLLRKTSLDELPQLWNVFKGEMSIVGPRPLLMEYLPYYTEREAQRHLVRPGITGLAQISGRNKLDWRTRLELDVHYVEHQSLWLDLGIFVKTLGKVIRRADVVVIPGTQGRKLSDERRAEAVPPAGGEPDERLHGQTPGRA